LTPWSSSDYSSTQKSQYQNSRTQSFQQEEIKIPTLKLHRICSTSPTTETAAIKLRCGNHAWATQASKQATSKLNRSKKSNGASLLQCAEDVADLPVDLGQLLVDRRQIHVLLQKAESGAAQASRELCGAAQVNEAAARTLPHHLRHRA
jgi:hypothetical protein